MGTFVNLPIRIAGQILSVNTYSELPTGCIPAGSIRYIEDTAELVVWNGTQWGFWLDTLEVSELIVNDISYINANVVEIGDNIILLNSDVTGTPTENSGLEVERGTEPNAILYWDETQNAWYHGTIGNVFPIPTDSIGAIKIGFTCLASAAIYDWVVMSATVDGQVDVVANNTYSDLVIGTICDKPTATTCNVLILGRLTGFSGLTPGKRVFVSTSGTATTTKPATGAVQVIGTAITATEMLVDVERTKVIQS